MSGAGALTLIGYRPSFRLQVPTGFFTRYGKKPATGGCRKRNWSVSILTGYDPASSIKCTMPEEKGRCGSLAGMLYFFNNEDGAGSPLSASAEACSDFLNNGQHRQSWLYPLASTSALLLKIKRSSKASPFICGHDGR